jgi:hypothetical protein
MRRVRPSLAFALKRGENLTEMSHCEGAVEATAAIPCHVHISKIKVLLSLWIYNKMKPQPIKSKQTRKSFDKNRGEGEYQTKDQT